MRAQALNLPFKLLVRAASWVVSLAAFGFFVRLIARNGVALPGRDGWEIARITLASSVLYGMAVMLLSLLWILLAAPRDAEKESARSLAASYLKSQFAKYLPGNVFHYAARHALGRQLGIPHSQLVGAALLEASLMVCASSFIIGSFGLQISARLFPQIPLPPWPIGLLVPLLIIPLLAIAPKLPKLDWLPHSGMRRLLVAFAGYAFFFVVFGGLFLGLLIWTTRTHFPPLQVISASSLAWLVGFIVPGAPAGAGLRETALTLATGGHDTSKATLAAIMLFRLATMGGDFLAFAAGWMLSRGRASSA